MRGLRRATENVPNPTRVTGWPRLRETRIEASRSDSFGAKITVSQYGRLVATLPWAVALEQGMFKQAGVDIRVCGQGLIARKIEGKQVNPDVQIDLWAMTTLVNLQLKGYVRVG